ncbi:hypothetical protein ABZV75_25455 [Streptomyces flaveolus]|uniref:hypothetical protein n=1 Tax=Streptomyces flaveolus TaxID=67297 RepID=UPI0033B7C6FA
MPDPDSCPPARRRRTAVFAAVVSLFASLLTLTGASPAVAADEERAPLTLASFGDPADAVTKTTVPAESSTCFTVTAPAAGLYLMTPEHIDMHAQTYAADGSEVDCYEEEQFHQEASARCPPRAPAR